MSPRSLPLFACSATALLAAGPAGAGDIKHGEGPFVAVHDCTCRLGGEDVALAQRPLGQRRCIGTDEGSDSAVRVTEQDVTSRRRSQDGCPEASLAAPRG